jgi:hypothetical protein
MASIFANEKVKKSDHILSNIWNHFERTPFKSVRHYTAKCKYYTCNWTYENPKELEEHLANECKDVLDII